MQIALWGTLLSVLLALPLCFLGARNLSPSLAVFHATRQVFNALRGINEIIFALIFVAAVGLGPFAGVLALSIHGAGMLGKFFAEAVEEIDAGPVEALRATGTRPSLVVVFGVLPQVIPSWIASTLYRFEVNLRAATILGMIGAGGIGFELVSLPQAVPVPGHRHLRAGDPGHGDDGRLSLLEAARSHPRRISAPSPWVEIRRWLGARVFALGQKPASRFRVY